MPRSSEHQRHPKPACQAGFDLYQTFNPSGVDYVTLTGPILGAPVDQSAIRHTALDRHPAATDGVGQSSAAANARNSSTSTVDVR